MPESWPEPLLSPLLLAAYIACVTGAGALANCSLLAVLHKSSARGLFSIILQLAIADIVLSASISPEVWSYNMQSWMLGTRGCIAYRGLSVFASTASSYLVATLALHTLATTNLEEKELMRRNRRSDQVEDDEMRSSRHSLVAGSDSSTPPRTMNLDYRVSAVSIPITQPTLFVWILSLSLCVPDFALATTVHFALATTVHLDQNTVVCTIVDSSQRLQLYTILALMNLVLPILLLCATLALVVIKLKSKSHLNQIHRCESIASLKLSLWLLLVYFILSVPRSTLIAFNTYSASLRANETALHESVQYYYKSSSIGLAFSSTYLGSILVRPLLCIVLLPSVKRAFTSGLRDTANV
ncbi:Uncharacterized protein OBRU01_00520 [Operophtera brumata]|uniref:G-protein coupled receptors family 1 profile domain-containing protein n=1 Tax=Operophtera brumata TaxID=104452 RepID=A0A0L7LW14_OPEBR|nr:Uncharacterized protein OBRU01_00520 [Operophtera brumata]